MFQTSLDYKKILIAVFFVCLIPIGYVGYLAYEVRNISPFQRDTDQYEGWMFAHYNEGLVSVENCQSTDSGWAEDGVVISQEFTAGCLAWFEKR